YQYHLLQKERFLLFGRLTSEYIVNIYSRIEEEHLNFILKEKIINQRKNKYRQTNITIEEDFRDEDNENEKINLHLSASFLGSKRWCLSHIALARCLGKPSFFITINTNPNWKEIHSQLQPGQNALEITPIIFHNTLSSALLLDWYFLCPSDPLFNKLKYTEYYENYILYPFTQNHIHKTNFIEKEHPNVPKKIVQKRTTNKITRIVLIAPGADKIFYLKNYQEQLKNNYSFAIEITLQKIASILAEHEHHMRDFGLPEPHTWTQEITAELQCYSDYI
ncbi:31457_t:CDS:2, partial [Gigaspora margarita]